jgi:CheY-like chemotaxis protein
MDRVLLVEDNDRFAEAAIRTLSRYSIDRAKTFAEAEAAIQRGYDLHLIDGCFPFGCDIPTDRIDRFFQLFQEISSMPFEYYAGYLGGQDTDQLPIGLFLAHDLQEQGKAYMITTGGNRGHHTALGVIEEVCESRSFPFYSEHSSNAKAQAEYWIRVQEILERLRR